MLPASVAGPGVLAAVIEVLRVFALQRLDLALDEGVELAEVALDLGRDGDAASTRSGQLARRVRVAIVSLAREPKPDALDVKHNGSAEPAIACAARDVTRPVSGVQASSGMPRSISWRETRWRNGWLDIARS